MQEAKWTHVGHRAGIGLARMFQALLRFRLALVPFATIAYLQSFQETAPEFHHHVVHEMSIVVSTLLSGSVTIVTWVGYRSSGEVFLRWLVLGVMGFTLLSSHGVFTRMGEHHLQFFITYGAVSRLVVATCFMVAVLRFAAPWKMPVTRAW